MDIQIIKVSTNAELNQFIDFPKELYKTERNFVFEPVSMQREFLSTKNPFFDHSDVTYYLAISNQNVVGRIAAIINRVHNKEFNDRTGFFGFFESIENYDVTRSLLDKVAETHMHNGLNILIGPTNFTTNDSCGLLISGFDSPAVVMMPYNKEYYNDYLLRYGFVKTMDLFSYSFNVKKFITPAYDELTKRISNKLSAAGIRIRPINYKILDKEIISFREVYNLSNMNNWGFIPLNEKEFRHTAYQFKQFVPEKLMLIAEKDNKQIGFFVALPNLNQVFSHIKSGKLFPFGFLKFLWYQRKITTSRMLILGILPEYRNMCIDFMLYKQIQENLDALGILRSEACYVMENNIPMRSILDRIGDKSVKTYRIYKYSLTDDRFG
jgi:ribosomal protein S18 acetylase RimI-like enzyme